MDSEGKQPLIKRLGPWRDSVRELRGLLVDFVASSEKTELIYLKEVVTAVVTALTDGGLALSKVTNESVKDLSQGELSSVVRILCDLVKVTELIESIDSSNQTLAYYKHEFLATFKSLAELLG